MGKIAIIGGTGLTKLPGITRHSTQTIDTPYGAPSGQLVIAEYEGKEIIFLPRHGDPHRIPPHKINYRANIDALKTQDVDQIIAVNAVGGITSRMPPATLVIPEQIIDYTYGREHTFYDGIHNALKHIDFTRPYNDTIRTQLLTAGANLDIALFDGGVHAVTQGPRLETAAEIDRLEKAGCDIVGMTGMPEAALAHEADLGYACLALVVNWSAGKTADEITEEAMEKYIDKGMKQVAKILRHTVTIL